MSGDLPPWFAALEPLLDRWAPPTTAQRAALRGDSTPAERQHFYDVVAPHAAAALDWLDSRPWGAYSASETRLLNLLCAFAHISIAVEIQQGAESRHAAARRHMAITRSPADETTR